MKETEQDGWRLAFAFFSLVHHDPRHFNELEPRLKDTLAGRLCSEYLELGDHQLIEKTGYLLTGTEHWYTYLGRMM